jgi:hypothetical protein
MFSTDCCTLAIDVVLRPSNITVEELFAMVKSPILKTMDEMLAKLREVTLINRETAKQITEYTNAIRALALVHEDEDVRNEYLLTLEEIGGKAGFADAIRSVMKPGVAMTPKNIRDMILLLKKMDLSGYTNAMASIHTTLRRMKTSGEVEDCQNTKGEKAYRLRGEFKRGDFAKALATEASRRAFYGEK